MGNQLAARRNATMARALCSCDVYCCAGFGFTGTEPYTKDIRGEIQCSAPVLCTSVFMKLWHVVVVPV